MLYDKDILKVLREKSEKVGQKKFADSVGFSQSFISDVLRGRRHVSDDLANVLGYDRRIVFVKRQK